MIKEPERRHDSDVRGKREEGNAMSTIITVDDAQTNLKSLIKQLAPGEEVVITENQQPVAKLVPVVAVGMTDVRKVVGEMLAYRDLQNRTLGGVSVRELVEEGRRF
jgi:antitoxin (DNA-binding transcriptional repressor) of toxin-antitoxin stability system